MIIIPVSIGELYDKITILEIKLFYIKDNIKQKNIEFELNLLYGRAKKYSINPILKKELLTINKRLWKLENIIRYMDLKKKFNENFINIAREIYITNDRRSNIKKIINLEYNSTIIEEKSY